MKKKFCSASIFYSDSYPAVLPSSQEVATYAITVERANHIFSPISELKSAFKYEIWERREIKINVVKRFWLEGFYFHTHTHLAL